MVLVESVDSFASSGYGGRDDDEVSKPEGSSSSSRDGVSSDSNNNNAQRQPQQSSSPILSSLMPSSRQTRRVRFAQFLVWFSLFGSGIGITTSSYLVLQNKSKNDVDATVYASIVGLVFLILLGVFGLYDVFVRQRQKFMQDMAVSTGAVVSSLFPDTVRDRILQNAMSNVSASNNRHPRSQRNRRTSNNHWNYHHHTSTFPVASNTSGRIRLREFLNHQTSGSSHPSDNHRHHHDYLNHHDSDHNNNNNNIWSSSSISLPAAAPIAEFFPNVTIMFADICGFTAWSSVREPTQVFTLLETIYQAFDRIARRRRVFKVETIGDCYVAVVGLPEPRKDHALAACRFARNCLVKMNDTVKVLEKTLGPGTGELCMRIGIHSGPVTAGVLRGDKGRFQLFGDSVNTCARIETTGLPNRIHLSKECAELLMAAGKSHWIERREDLVEAKGKGKLETFWLNLGSTAGTSDHSGSSAVSSTSNLSDMIPDQIRRMSAGRVPRNDSSPMLADLRESSAAAAAATDKPKLDDHMQRLVDWNVDVLAQILKQVVAIHNKSSNHLVVVPNEEQNKTSTEPMVNEIADVIELPDPSDAASINPDTLTLDEKLMDQLFQLIVAIALTYRDNPFHSFEHASHITMSVVKLLNRIVAPENDILDHHQQNTEGASHDHTFGISHPLTQFACVFAALLRGIDHRGVPNSVLVEEHTDAAEKYLNRSVSEQNSIDIGWELFTEDRFQDLRLALCPTKVEMNRFRQLLVNSVMATDILDMDMEKARNRRWDRAFGKNVEIEEASRAYNRKATIVLEHLLQASDVAHTMQHWFIFRKWNERQFMECYRAFKNGRTHTDPADYWYKNELDFFDYHIIPLAKKLKECGVFGVGSAEYLNYATKNREEWELRGSEVVSSIAEKAESLYDEFSSSPSPLSQRYLQSMDNSNNDDCKNVESADNGNTLSILQHQETGDSLSSP